MNSAELMHLPWAKTRSPLLSGSRCIETTVSLEKEVGEHADVFIEYVGDYPEHGPSPIFLNAGGAYRLTKAEQLDFHLAVGLDKSAPDYIFGLGYSFRVDGLF